MAAGDGGRKVDTLPIKARSLEPTPLDGAKAFRARRLPAAADASDDEIKPTDDSASTENKKDRVPLLPPPNVGLPPNAGASMFSKGNAAQ